MTLPLDYEQTRERIGALVGLMLGVGYSVAAIAPFLLGAVRDVTDSFDAVLWACAGFLVVLVGLVRLLPRPAAGYPGG
jgi:cyanate permease